MKKNKRFKVQSKFYGKTECSTWQDVKWFNDFESARKHCDQLFKQLKGRPMGFDLKTIHWTRVIDNLTDLRVYPYQKDKTGAEIIPIL